MHPAHPLLAPTHILIYVFAVLIPVISIPNIERRIGEDQIDPPLGLPGEVFDAVGTNDLVQMRHMIPTIQWQWDYRGSKLWRKFRPAAETVRIELNGWKSASNPRRQRQPRPRSTAGDGGLCAILPQ